MPIFTLKDFIAQNPISAFDMCLPEKGKVTEFSGLNLSAQCLMVADLYLKQSESIVWVLQDMKSLEAAREDLYEMLGEESVVYFPGTGLKPYEMKKIFGSVAEQRIQFLKSRAQNIRAVYLCIPEHLMELLPRPKDWFDSALLFKKNQVIDYANLRNHLNLLGYQEESKVEDIGQYSLKMGKLDIYPTLSDYPFRIDFFDDEIESIRSFDIFDQLSMDTFEEARIFPVQEWVLNQENFDKGLSALLKEFPNKESEIEDLQNFVMRGESEGIYWVKSWFALQQQAFLDCFTSNTLFVVQEYSTLENRLKQVWASFVLQAELSRNLGYLVCRPEQMWARIYDVTERFKNSPSLGLSQIEWNPKSHFNAQDQQRSKLTPDQVFDLVQDLKSSQIEVWVLATTQGQAERLEHFLEDAPITGVLVGQIHHGFVLPSAHLALLTDHQLFNRFARKQRIKKSRKGAQIPNFDAMQKGDYVLHSDYGLGQFVGLTRLKTSAGVVDCLLVEYNGKDRLTFPVTDLSKLEKYNVPDGHSPQLHKLGGRAWDALKEKAQKNAVKIAQELVALYAKRQLQEGYQFPPDSELQKEFENAFDYDPTPDQLKATQDCKRDMESISPMDRLVCGDVGYGKTEVAMRAAFKAVCAKKQVAVLVPTTILAQQHYESFCERMSGWPVNISLVNRFVGTKEKNKIFSEMKHGSIDILVGTHSLLSEKLEFKDLGLFIIDEEQKFGVKQKERLRELKLDIDCLSMSATPIPRSLHLSLTGVRDISLITTPPRNRLPIETRVVEFHENIIRDAVAEELNRGGQVFIVNDHIKELDELALLTEKCVENARVAVAHGQMNDRDLEQVMSAFINREFDVLVCTTIVESGIDIPSVNTILIHNAHRFGVSQLYQLRGRVGRSDVHAYAYLLIPPGKQLSKDSENRLKALEMFTDLGSGYKLAMRDLEIRGAGNLLGTEQHGFIAEVGYETYLKLVQEAVLELQGKNPEPEFEPRVDLNTESYIPEVYVEDALVRIQLYQRLVRLNAMEGVKHFENELLDRFGPIPLQMEVLLASIKIRLLCKKLHFEAAEVCSGGGMSYGMISLARFLPIQQERMAKILDQCPVDHRIIYGEPLQIRLSFASAGEREKLQDPYVAVTKLASILEAMAQGF